MSAARWSTTSHGQTTDTSPGELSALGEHLDVCSAASGRLFGLRCQAQKLHGFLAPRLISTLVVVALLVALVWAWH